MKQMFLLTIILTLSATISFAQLEKGKWIAGGAGLFSHEKINESADDDYTQTISVVSGDLGFFFTSRFVAGVKPGFSSSATKQKGNGVTIRHGAADVVAGPFVRYYLLPVRKKITVMVEADYQFGRSRYSQTNQLFSGETVTHASATGYSFTAGPVFFVNKGLGLELLAGYAESKIKNDVETTGFQIGVGLQVYF